MTKEYLSIENFAGLDEEKIELGRMNVFIGPQASGKSVCAKLFFFFKECASVIAYEALDEQTKSQIRRRNRETFLKYFPPDFWGKGPFKLRYSCGEIWIEILRKSNEAKTVEIAYSPQYDRLLATGRQMLKATESLRRTAIQAQQPRNDQYKEIFDKIASETEPVLTNANYFIPAGRSFFSTLRANVFQFLAIDPFLISFGILYQDARRNFASYSTHGINDNKKTASHMSKLICGSYRRVRTQDYIVMDDNRQVAIEHCSSGQQEALPLTMVLSRMGLTSSGISHSTIFIEEPEANLYPGGQREMVHLMIAALDLSSASSSQYLITTHSPYILSALNNIMYAGKIAHEYPDKRDRVTSVLGEDMLIDPADVRAYFVSDGRIKSIIDPETGLVNAARLDSVSGALAEEFDRLVDIEFEEKLEEKVA